MKQYIGLLAFALACGGVADEGDQGWIGEAEQSYTSADGFGWRSDLTAGQQVRCANVPAPGSQVCLLPPDKNITVRITTDGISAAEKTALEGIVTSVYANWTTQLNDPTWSLALTQSSGDVNVRYGALTGNPITSIHRFARVTIFNRGAPLDDAGRSGEWRKMSGTQTCTIDKAAIDANFNTQLKRDRVRSHALYTCMLRAMGMGTGGAVTKAYAIAVTPDNAKDITLGQKVKCMLGMLTSTSGSDWNFNAACNNVTDD